MRDDERIKVYWSGYKDALSMALRVIETGRIETAITQLRHLCNSIEKSEKENKDAK